MKLQIFVAVLCLTIIATGVECGRRSNWRRHNRHNSNSTGTTARPAYSECPSIECEGQHGQCPYGPNQDENLCTLCGCRPSRRCGLRVACMMACPNGFQNGPDGCPTCRCYTAPPPEAAPLIVSSGNRSYPGYHSRHNHTRQHQYQHQQQQQQQNQSSVSIELYARTKSVNVNETAGQLPAPAVSSWQSRRDRTETNTTCEPMCNLFCEHGFKRDRRSCSLCECNNGPIRRRSPECTRPRCLMFCENGFQIDTRGCSICRCQDPAASTGSGPAAVAAGLQCPRLRCHAHRRCANGFEVDLETGCRSCVCRATAPA